MSEQSVGFGDEGRCDMRTRTLMVVLMVLIGASLLGIAGGADKVLYDGAGTQLYLGPFSEEYTIASSDPCWVRHGWEDFERFPGMVSGFIHSHDDVTSPGGFFFQLEIDGKRIHLNRQVIAYPLDEPGHTVMKLHWWIQFPSGYFPPGEYELTGTWGCRNPRSPNAAPNYFVRTVSLIVTP